MIADFDLAIVGSGFGGSLLAMVARRLGLSVILLERGTHPRFAIGESTSPLANLLLEELARQYDLPRLLPLTSFGSWQRTYPGIACGLKRGFTFYHHEAGQPFAARQDRSNQLMVAASPADSVADMHWFRADVDHFLQKEAVAAGAEYLDNTLLASAERTGERTALVGTRADQPVRITAHLVVDATGPRGFLSRALGLTEGPLPGLPATRSLFSHFTGVRRCEEMEEFRPSAAPPYAPDDAALHHVFDGGWMWVLRFGNGITSAGFALEERAALEIELAEREPAWDRVMAGYPSIGRQFADAAPVQPFTYVPRLAYRASAAAGGWWAMLPSAAAFIDPLLSTGIPLTLIGIHRLAAILATHRDSPSLPERLQEYGELTLSDADWTAAYIGGCYGVMRDLQSFVALSMYYFAAASFSEMAHRLRRPGLVSRFFGQDRPDFGPALARHAAEARLGGTITLEQAGEGIAPLNVAGLCDSSKRNWYPVDLDDVVRGAEKLGFQPSEVDRTLDTAPWGRPALAWTPAG